MSFFPIHNLNNNSKEFSEYVYKTKSSGGRHIFRFKYVLHPNGYYEIVILEQPSYNGRNTSAHITHRMSSTTTSGKRIICISNPRRDTKTLAQAQSISTGWSELTSNYILRGESIDNQVAKMNH